MHTIDLNGPWKVRAAGSSARIPVGAGAARRWMDATVPGVIHTDLMKAGVIPDPFVGTNEDLVQWVADVPWLYRRTITIDRDTLDESRVELVAEGLDTIARIAINGKPVGTSRNMFTGVRFDIRRFLRPGRNFIAIRFDSPVAAARAAERARGRLQVELQPHRVHIRKAQYSFGWDWGPRLTTSGIWRPMRIEAFSHGRLRDPFVHLRNLRGSSAVLDVSATIEAGTRISRMLRVRIKGHGVACETIVRALGGTVRATVTIKPVRLWWPNGHGEQPMYTAILTLLEGSREVDTIRVPFAVRTVRLVQEPDREGQSFIFEVNGRRLFCKGADWIPADSFLPRVTSDVYERLLVLARDASMNMIRVWGGGVYEDDLFYDLCDRLGLMVWQDFMYACGEYPDHAGFLREAAREAKAAVRRLRNHPSIVLWCGNNECEWIFCTKNPGKGPDDMRGAPIFRDVLPREVRRNDGTRPFWRSSPFGRGFPNDERSGNHHQWEVWSHWKDFKEYEKNRARFVSEFGFQGPAHQATLGRVVPRAERSVLSATMEHHNKQIEGTPRLIRFLSAHLRLPRTWREFIHAGQVVQAEALKCGVEHWRRRKFQTAGTLFWQLNDCWPVTSWSVIDSDLRPKAAYYYARRFFAPLLVSIVGTDGGLEVWGTNDGRSTVGGELRVDVRGTAGGMVWRRAVAVRLPANSSRVLHAISRGELGEIDMHSSYVRAELRAGVRPASVNRYFFCEHKHLRLGRAIIQVSVKSAGRTVRALVLTSSSLAVAVHLASRSRKTQFLDNYVTLDPGVPWSVPITSELSTRRLRKDIIVRALPGP